MWQETQSWRKGSAGARPRTQSAENGAGGGPRALADVLSLLQALRGHGRTFGTRQLTELWRRIAGPEISERTKVIGLKNGTLQVGVGTAALLGELTSFHQRRLLAALRSDPEGQRIKKLKFQLRGK
jgi:hypothetical protein